MTNENQTCSTEINSCSTQQPSQQGECDMHEKMLCLADEAWKEVVKEKMKAEIEKSCGEKIQKMAAFVTEANHHRWKHMLGSKKKCEEYKQNFRSLMCSIMED